MKNLTIMEVPGALRTIATHVGAWSDKDVTEKLRTISTLVAEHLNHPVEAVDCGGCAPPIIVEQPSSTISITNSKAAAWVLPTYADRDSEGIDKGDVLDLKFHPNSIRPAGDGWVPMFTGYQVDKLLNAIKGMDFTTALL